MASTPGLPDGTGMGMACSGVGAMAGQPSGTWYRGTAKSMRKKQGPGMEEVYYVGYLWILHTHTHTRTQLEELNVFLCLSRAKT